MHRMSRKVGVAISLKVVVTPTNDFINLKLKYQFTICLTSHSLRSSSRLSHGKKVTRTEVGGERQVLVSGIMEVKQTSIWWDK